MAKWYNTATGLEVPASSVRELQPGTGLFVHEMTTTATKLVIGGTRTGPTVEVIPNSEMRTVDGYAVRLEDSETYDPNVNYLANQVLALQTAIRVRGGV